MFSLQSGRKMVLDLFKKGKKRFEMASDVIGFKYLHVNFYFIGEPGEGNPWTLIDTGIIGSGRKIIKESTRLFGKDNPPQAILLTHGHFDHIGGLHELLRTWPEVKIYVHPLEIPYLTGNLNFPPPDNTGGSPAMAYLLQLYSGNSLNFSNQIRPLPDGWVPTLSGWRYIHTPGVSPGHVSFFRQEDKLLLAGDIISYAKLGTITSVVNNSGEILSGPPAHYTIRKSNIWNSLKKIESLNPQVIGVSHGRPVPLDVFGTSFEDLLKVYEKEKSKEDDYYVTTQLPDKYYLEDKKYTLRKYGKFAAVLSLILAGAGIGYLFARKSRC